jgi:hypothetical protein
MTQERHPFERGPYLNAAVLCERVLTEQDGVNSVIRIIDRITNTATGPELPLEMPPSVHTLWLYISFKSGSRRGGSDLTIRMQKPSGDGQVNTLPVHFEGEDDRGVNLKVEMRLELDMAGLWWFDIGLDGVLVTKLPLRVIYLRQVTPGPGPTQGGEAD